MHFKRTLVLFSLFVSVFMGMLTDHCVMETVEQHTGNVSIQAHETTDHQHDEPEKGGEHHACHSGNCFVVLGEMGRAAYLSYSVTYREFDLHYDYQSQSRLLRPPIV